MLVATISGEGIKTKTREYGTVTRSLTELKDWLLENEVILVVMESTGVYKKPVYHVLKSSGLAVWIIIYLLGTLCGNNTRLVFLVGEFDGHCPL